MYYEIKITYAPLSEENEVITLKTSDIEWTMKQYQRNRKTFTWEIIKKSGFSYVHLYLYMSDYGCSLFGQMYDSVRFARNSDNNSRCSLLDMDDKVY